MVILIVSDQEELINIQIEKIKKNNLEEVNEFTYSFYDNNFVDFSNILEDLETVSFFNKRVVVVKNFDLKNTKEIEKYLKNNDNEDVTLVLPFNEIDKKTDLYKLIKNKGQVIDIKTVDKKEKNLIIKKMFDSRDVYIYDDAFNEFVNRVDFNLTLIKNEILKLKSLNKKITKEDVINLISRKLDDNIFDILDGILKQDYAKSLQTYHSLINNGYKSFQIILTIASSLRFLYQVKLLSSEGKSENEIASILNAHPYRVKVNLQNSYQYSSEQILSLLNDLFELDFGAKTGQLDIDKGLELFILRREGR